MVDHLSVLFAVSSTELFFARLAHLYDLSECVFRFCGLTRDLEYAKSANGCECYRKVRASPWSIMGRIDSPSPLKP